MHRCFICARFDDDGKNCYDCYKHVCHKCNAKICMQCVQQACDCNQCQDCNTVRCLSCMEDGDYFLCDRCPLSCCSDCRLQRFRQGEIDCAECVSMIDHLLVAESIVYKRLKDEVDQLKAENEELKRENKDLQSRK